MKRTLGHRPLVHDAGRLKTFLGTTPGGSGSGPADATYLTLSLHADLSAERKFVDGDGLVATDGGANGDFTLDVDLATTSGLELTGVSPNKDLQIADALAGDGLTITSKVLAVNTGTGLAISGDAVILAWSGVPGTIQPDASAASGSSNYAARTDHTHAIVCAAPGANITVSTTKTEGISTSFARADHGHAVTTSSNPGGTASILATDAAGKVQLVGLGIGTAPGDAAIDILETGIGHLRFTRVGDANYTDWNMSSNTVLETDIYNASADVYWRIKNSHASYRAHIGLNCDGDAQFDLDVGGNVRVQGWIVGKHAIQLSGALAIFHYDGPEPLETNYAGTCVGHMGQVATTSGGVVFRPGKFQKGVQIAEATTNEFIDPCHDGTGNWTAGGTTPPTVTEQSTAITPFTETKTCKVVFPLGCDTGFAGCRVQSRALSIGDGETHTFSIWVQADSISEIAKLSLYVTGHEGFTSITLDGFVTAVDGWYRGVRTFTKTGAGSQYLAIYANTSLTSSLTLYLDGEQHEEKAHATPLCHGEMGAIVNGSWVEDATSTHNWSGTAHASTSTRTAATVVYGASGNWNNGGSNTVMMWYKPAAPGITRFDLLQIYGSTSNDRVALLKSGNNLTAQLYSGGVTQASLTYDISGWAAETWYHIVVVIAEDDCRLYVNGDEKDSDTSCSLMATNATNIKLQEWSASYFPNGVIDEFAITDNAMDEDEVRAIYESEAPVFAETGTFQFSAGPSQLVWADHEGMWARADDGGAALGLFCGTGTKSWGGFTMGPADLVLGENVSNSAAIHWDQSTGKFGFYGNANATVQVEIGTDGSLLAGAGDVKLNVDGIRIVPGTNDKNILAWLDSNDDIPLDMWGTMIGGSGAGYVYAFADDSLSGKIANLNLRALAGAETHIPASPISGIRIYTYMDTSASSKIEFEVHDSIVATMTTAGLGIGIATVAAKCHIDQSAPTGNAIPVLALDQADLSEEFINFITTTGAGNPIEVGATGTLYGVARVAVNGTFKYLALYNEPA